MKIHTCIKTVILLFFITVSFSKITAQEKIIGPYVQNMSDDEVTICWSTFEGTTSISNSDSVIQKVSQYRQHKSIITRLEANTTYSYDVLNDGTDKGKGNFTTFHEKTKEFHFAVLGDTRTRHDIHQRIVCF